VLFIKYYSGDQIEGEICGTCSKYGSDDKPERNYGRKTWEDQDRDLGINGIIILKWVLKK